MHLAERWTLGKMQNPVRGFLHGSAAVLSVGALVWLLIHSIGGVGRNIALAIFGSSLIVLYIVSTLYHVVPWQQVWKKRMQRVDHSTIMLFIAASYTPVAIVVFDGWLRIGTMVVVWSIAAVGVTDLVLFPRTRTGVSIAVSTTLGCLSVALAGPVLHLLGWQAIVLMSIGGAAYLVGMIFLVTNRPRLWPRVFSYHEVFHVLVIAGTAFHFLAVMRYVARYTGA